MANDVIVLTGLKETLSALESFDKQAVRNFTSVINRELSSAKKDAQALVTSTPPLSGWSTTPPANPRTRGGAGWPAWDQSVIKAGISSSRAEGKVSRSKGYTTSAGALKNRSAAGVIYELAGRTNKSAGVHNFISNLEKKSQDASRLVWKVVDKDRDKIQRNVVKALEDAKIILQKNLEKERG
jgi:hypothetical protein